MAGNRIVSLYVVRSPGGKREVARVMGVVVELDGVRHTLRIESSATVAEEIESLRRILYANGFSKRAIASAVKQIKNGSK